MTHPPPSSNNDSTAYVRKVLVKADIRGRRWGINQWIVSHLDTLDITLRSHDNLWAWSNEEAARKIRKPGEWSTFTECFNYTLRHNGDDFMLEVTVWQGDSCYGTPTYARFTCDIKVPPECVHVFHKDAEAALARYLDAAWQEHEDRRRACWIEAARARVMGDAEGD